MKKVLLLVLAITVMFAGFGFAQDKEKKEDYYNKNNPYDNYALADIQFKGSNAAKRLEMYKGKVYYYHHYRANVYFVLAAQDVFVVPAYLFRDYMKRPNYYWAAKNDFVALSSASFGNFYDSWVRFNYYNTYFDHNSWTPRSVQVVSRNYGKYFNKRGTSKRYYKGTGKVSAIEGKYMSRASQVREGKLDLVADYKAQSTPDSSGYAKRVGPVSTEGVSAASKSARSVRSNGGNSSGGSAGTTGTTGGGTSTAVKKK